VQLLEGLFSFSQCCHIFGVRNILLTLYKLPKGHGAGHQSAVAEISFSKILNLSCFLGILDRVFHGLLGIVTLHHPLRCIQVLDGAAEKPPCPRYLLDKGQLVSLPTPPGVIFQGGGSIYPSYKSSKTRH
jgi:hypothetical protein